MRQGRELMWVVCFLGKGGSYLERRVRLLFLCLQGGAH